MKTMTFYRPNSRVDQLVDSIFDWTFSAIGDTPINGHLPSKLPLMDFSETDDAYLVEAELPGIDEKHINLHIEGTQFTLEANNTANNAPSTQAEDTAKPEPEAPKQGSYLVRERRKLAFKRTFTLPENADTEAVSAAFKDGVLSVQIKKRPQAARRLIEINAS